jgi:hypothetical protein
MARVFRLKDFRLNLFMLLLLHRLVSGERVNRARSSRQRVKQRIGGTDIHFLEQAERLALCPHLMMGAAAAQKFGT